jgi:hypothetical protein
MPGEAKLERLGGDAPVLTSAKVGVFTVTSETRYEDIRADIEKVSGLTPTGSELVILANKNPVPDEWWDEEG